MTTAQVSAAPSTAQSGDIIINGGNISVRSINGAGIGTGSGHSYVDSIKIHVDAEIISTGLHGEDIGRGVTGRLGNEVEYFDDSDDMSAFGLGTSTPVTYDGNPLWIQHGTQSNQRIHVYINSMQTKDIGLDNVEVTTRDKALDAIAKVESALEYALDEATNMGAYLQRLDFTDSNVTTMGENVQNAESVIRDVDMAREMTEYTKYNLLTQSSQAMLAQANQNQSSILSLLQ